MTANPSSPIVRTPSVPLANSPVASGPGVKPPATFTEQLATGRGPQFAAAYHWVITNKLRGREGALAFEAAAVKQSAAGRHTGDAAAVARTHLEQVHRLPWLDLDTAVVTVKEWGKASLSPCPSS